MIQPLLQRRDDRLHAQILGKIKCKRNELGYRKLISVDDNVYENITSLVQESILYNPNTLLESKNQWYRLTEFSHNEFLNSNLNSIIESSASYSMLKHEEWGLLVYLLVINDNFIYIQGIGKNILVKKKKLFKISDGFQYDAQREEIIIKDIPDAIYDIGADTLYFQKLLSLTKIFPGIDSLYKEATDQEIKTFLKQSFIVLKNGFGYSEVKTLNRKRIALLQGMMVDLSIEEKMRIISYIGEYCSSLKRVEDAFEIGTEKDLKLLLYGLQERFYTTPIGDEKRIANSIIPIKENR